MQGVECNPKAGMDGKFRKILTPVYFYNPSHFCNIQAPRRLQFIYFQGIPMR